MHLLGAVHTLLAQHSCIDVPQGWQISGDPAAGAAQIVPMLVQVDPSQQR
jgi:hypothetical protein